MKSKFVLGVILFTLSACIGSKNNVEYRNRISDDFGSDKEAIILCILTEEKAFDDEVFRKAMSELYSGKYEFVTREELRDDRYKNIEKYRYYLGIAHHQRKKTVTEYSPKGKSPYSIETTKTVIKHSKNCFFTDRKEEEEFQWQSLTKLVEELEMVRKKNAGG